MLLFQTVFFFFMKFTIPTYPTHHKEDKMQVKSWYHTKNLTNP